MTLMEAHAHACRLPEDIGNIRTKVMYVKLAAREDHGGIPAKYFRVVDAYPISVVEAMWRPSPWPGSLLQLKSMQDESEQLGRGRMGAAMIECPPLAVQTVPFGSVTEQSLRGLTIASNWKEVLMHLVEGGTRFSGRKSGR
ncbi:hypothetical protein PHLCEN_2v1935 [Hermanssonia centrifuga]|uniref:Uncharacterized protein n=1 Tax=Hermanssonia centrifuga TaxID=98765 RepID=A0A2R6RVJ6_9APHY|nr:hypothetical protein PHLCEN_2v1935 [Hermanssonia centrifuga]